jgi:phytanoyl-CoA hydroxylase
LSFIGQKRKDFWEQNGYLVLPGFFTPEEIDTVHDTYDRTWRDQPDAVVVDDLVEGRRLKISDVGTAERRHSFKVNDLYLSEPSLREVAISERLGMVLEELLGDEPVVCNTLNFDKGSQQADHLDTLYMTPPASERGLVATWMALEDATDDAGPLRYYPESNLIRPYRFSTGHMTHHPPEMPQFFDYMAGEVERRGLYEQRFLARRGDLFIWHALLLHGGCEIVDPQLTRQSMVTHYWTQSDCETRSMDLRPAPGGWWFNRPAQPVPGQREAATPLGESSSETDLPAWISRPDARRGRELRERMEALLRRR